MIRRHTMQGYNGDPQLGAVPVRAARCLTLAGELVRSERVNAIIVGSGAGGGMMAKELAEAGLRVGSPSRSLPAVLWLGGFLEYSDQRRRCS